LIENEKVEKITYVYNRFIMKYPDADNQFKELYEKYLSIPNFKINENIFSVYPEYDDKLHYILRLSAQYEMLNVFKALKIDINDPNVAENIDDCNIGTAGRIIKMWTGNSTDDDSELMNGRFNKPVRLAKFPNDYNKKIPIIKEIDLTSVCSHHFAPFSTAFSDNSKVVVAYIPDKYVLGISKLQRVVRYIAQRGWLQEDLTKAIYDEIVKAVQTEDVYVLLRNVKHSCEFIRGALSQGNGFTTEYFGGKFDKTALRNDVLLALQN